MVDKTSRPWHAANLAAIAGGLLTLMTMTGFCLHLAGFVTYQTYLQEMGLHPDLFRQPSDWTVINGYSATLLQAISPSKSLALQLIILLSFAIAIVVFVVRIPTVETNLLRDWVNRWPSWLRSIALFVFRSSMGVLTFFSAVFLVLFFGVVTTIPALIGVDAGRAKALEMRSVIDGRTPRAQTEIWLAESRIMRGYIVASSAELLAFYDVDAGLIKTMSVEGVELRNPLPAT